MNLNVLKHMKKNNKSHNQRYKKTKKLAIILIYTCPEIAEKNDLK